MKDSDVEDLLRKFRPIGPPPRLRERVLAIHRTGRIWPWAAAAAALLISTVTLHLATRYEAGSLDSKLGPAVEAGVADDLTHRLGGGTDARELAEFMLIEQEVLAVAPVGEAQ